MTWYFVRHATLAVLVLLSALVQVPAAHADEAFQTWVAALWPEAQELNVDRATFDQTFRGMEPDFSIPDLALPGRDKLGSAGQAEFTRAPSEYLDRAYLMRLAETGKPFTAKYKAALDKIERETGVDKYALLAIWGRETAYGSYKLPHDAVRVLTTLAYVGRRKELFRKELLAALQMLQAGVARSDMKSSWAGAVGLTQFMPTEYLPFARDMDGDGKKDIFRSVPDALGSSAAQLAGKGWVAGHPWGTEVRIPASSDCSLEGPLQTRLISEWAKLGFQPARGKPWPEQQAGLQAYLMSPAGAYGPSFLVFDNFKVIRLYNTSDLYAVFVGHLADRIAGGGDFEKPWGGTGAQKTKVIEEIQTRLKATGYDVDKIDGKIGSNSRMNIGKYQRANGLKVDCWPTDATLAHMRSAASR